MAIQPPQSVQLTQDPYAVSRGGFSEVLGYFKEQRALKQNAKLMAEQFKQQQKSMQFEYDLRLRNDATIQGMKNQADIATAEATQQANFLKMFNDSQKVARDEENKMRARLGDLSGVFQHNLAPFMSVTGRVDPETLTPYVTGSVMQQRIDESGNVLVENVDYSTEDLERFIGTATQMKSVAKLIDDFMDSKVQKGNDTIEYGDSIQIGNDTRGREIVQALMSKDPRKFNDPEFGRLSRLAMDGKIMFTSLDSGSRTQERGYTAELDEEMGNLTTLISSITDASTQKIKYSNFLGSLTGGGKEFDFAQTPIQELVEGLRTTQNGNWDGLGDTQIQEMRLLSGILTKVIRLYRQNENPDKPLEVDMSNVYYDTKTGTLERKAGPKTTNAKPSVESNIYTQFNNTD